MPDAPEDQRQVTAATTRWRNRLARLEQLLNKRSASPSAQRWLLLVALVLFVLISVFSFSSLPDSLHPKWWALPILLVVTTPATVLCNSAEFRIMGQINGHRIGWLTSARLTVIAGAANMLPLPGGIVIRTQALRQRGSSYKHALAANAAAGIAWIGMACIVIGGLFTTRHNYRWYATGMVVLGVICLLGVLYILRRVDRPNATNLLVQLIAVEGATVFVSGARIYFAFQLIGLDATAAQSVALTASQIIAAAVGIFPAGLGLRELLAGAIGSAVDLSLSASVSATAADRLTAQVSLGLLTAVMLIFFRTKQPNQLDAEDAEAVEELSPPTPSAP